MSSTQTTTTREQAAREAFWGKRQFLYGWVLSSMSYEMNGVKHRANGCTLAECIAAVEAMPQDEFDMYVKL